MPLEWKEIYTLQHKKIDAQHQELFRIANTVETLDAHRTSKAQLAIIMKQFFEYMREHFKDEEAYMQSIDYPLLSLHKKLHENIIEAFTDMLKQTKEVEALIKKMQVVSHEWLIGHILDHDLQIEIWRKEHTILLDEYA